MQWGELACNRLTARHVRLTSHSKMSVKSAAQTLSASVARAMRDKDRFSRYELERMEETAKFVEMMDTWFDCMNTRPGCGKANVRMYKLVQVT